MDDIIPASFHNAYYSNIGKNRDFTLGGMLKALAFHNLLGLPSVSTLIFVISISSDFRKFLGFTRAPHPSQFSSFKLLFYDEILQTFHHLVDFTSDFAIDADEALANMLITDTTGFELYVKENNPKFYQAMLKTVKTYAKSLIPALETFFDLHPHSTFNYFLGDSGFDAVDHYAYLHEKNIIPIINLNSRNTSTLPQPLFNQDGVPI